MPATISNHCAGEGMRSPRWTIVVKCGTPGTMLVVLRSPTELCAHCPDAVPVTLFG